MLANHFEEAVAGRMAEKIVDRLEAVEIQEMQREQLIATTRASDQVAQAFLQEGAVRQVGQRVVMRKMM